MAGLLQQAGGQPQKQPRYVALFIDRNFTGLYTQRSPLHDPSSVIETKFYGGRPDALWMGSNVELTNRLTLQRRPGLSQFSTATYPAPPDRAFSFELTNGTIQVIIDTGSLSFNVTSVSIPGIGEVQYNGSFPGGAADGYLGYQFTFSGFANPGNNGTFTCVLSTASNLIFANPNAVAGAFTGTATTAGSVYVDNQNGTKTLLFGKGAGAGQTYFVAVAGVLYMGDGVDVRKYTPGGANGTVWNWGGAAPTTQPNVVTVESGSAATPWVMNTVFSTMGLLLDSNGHAEYLTSVNATGTNTTQLGSTGDGQPLWNDTTGSTTIDNTCNWTNWGPISLWAANTVYTYQQPIFDPGTGWIFQSSGGKSGTARPNFKGIINTHTSDANGMQWQAVGLAAVWKPNFTYHAWWEHNICIVCQPVLPSVALINSGTQTVYLESNNDQTTGTNDDPGVSGSGYTPAWPDAAGLTTNDGDLLWVDLGSATWQANHGYFAWSQGSTTFSVVEDPTGDFQVCVISGTSGSITPYTQWQASHSYTASSTIAVKFGGSQFMLFTSGAGTHTSGSTEPAWDFTTGHTTTDGAVTWTATGTIVTNVWGNTYGSNTSDGTVTWTNVGPTITWATSTQWYLPKAGFAPPSTSQPYGGAEVIGNGYVQAVISTGKSGSTQPNWPSTTAYVLTGVAAAVGQTAVYSGTITGGGSNAYVGYLFAISGFVNAANNGTFVCTASTTGALTLVNPSAVLESDPATATGVPIGSMTNDGTVIWYTDAAFSANSLAWTSGYVYAYSYEARLATDPYNTTAPPGVANPLGPPTGSETGLITTASPVFTITGSNAGAVNTVSGIGPTDPQFDTIVIWRSADGGGANNMFFLTEINAPMPIQGVAQPWQFVDYLPDVATNVFPGLNNLIPAPIDDENDPPPSNFLPMVYNFQRIWGASGQQVLFSGGPDVITGNPNEAFDPADSFPFLANVIRIVKTSQGLVVFLTDSIEIIAGGPLTSSFYSVTLAPGIGLGSYNAVDVYAGEIFFFSADSEFKVISPSLSLSNAGFPLGDKFAQFNASLVYVAVQQAGVDNAIYVSDGSTGWYRVNPRQVPGGYSGPEPIWSPFATITGGVQLLQSVEVSPGIKKLLVGSTLPNQSILERNLNVFTDNGTQYDANFIMGSIVLAPPGELAILKFLECDFSGTAYKPVVSYLLNEIAGTFTPFNLNPVFDPPSLYQQTLSPMSYSPNRYYFSGTGSLARCRHLQIEVDFGTTSNGDELLGLTIFGRRFIED